VGCDLGESATISGQVKWFDAAKGFGFIVADDFEKDILLHANVLRSFGQNSIASSSRIEMVVQETERGAQVVEIFCIQPPDVSLNGATVNGVIPSVSLNKDAPVEPARVKWFDRGKGFGFVNIFGRRDDIFIHMEVLHACGLADLQTGEAIGVRTAVGERGEMVWDVKIWDQASAVEE